MCIPEEKKQAKILRSEFLMSNPDKLMCEEVSSAQSDQQCFARPFPLHSFSRSHQTASLRQQQRHPVDILFAMCYLIGCDAVM